MIPMQLYTSNTHLKGAAAQERVPMPFWQLQPPHPRQGAAKVRSLTRGTSGDCVQQEPSPGCFTVPVHCSQPQPFQGVTQAPPVDV